MSDLKVGDVVVLKSGGPRMTVEQIGEDTYGQKRVWCVWFERNTKHDGDFPPETLTKGSPG